MTEKVTETVTQTLKGEETTSTRETRRQVTEYTATWEMTKIGERLHGVEEEKDAHAHTHIQVARDNGGELAQLVETRCGQLGVLPRERGEGVCPLEAGHDQADSVVPREVEGRSAADGCMKSLGGMKTPGALEVVRVPSMSVPVCVVASVAPVCVVSRCVFTSVFRCVLRRTHRAGERRCVREAPCVSKTPCVKETPCATPSATPGVDETPCVSGVVTSVPECVLPGTPCVKGAPQGEETMCAQETARVCEPPRVDETPRVSAPACVGSMVCVSEARSMSERPCARVTACVRSLCEREMTVSIHEHAAASPDVSMNGNLVMCGLSLATRGSVSARRAWRLRLKLWRDKCRVAAVVAIGTGPGLHGSARVERAVQRARPPRARLRG